MTKKDYILIAEVINTFEWSDPFDEKLKLAQAMAERFEDGHATFNRFKFIEACMKR